MTIEKKELSWLEEGDAIKKAFAEVMRAQYKDGVNMDEIQYDENGYEIKHKEERN